MIEVHILQQDLALKFCRLDVVCKRQNLEKKNRGYEYEVHFYSEIQNLLIGHGMKSTRKEWGNMIEVHILQQDLAFVGWTWSVNAKIWREKTDSDGLSVIL